MSTPKFARFPVEVSPDGKTATIECWFVNGKDKPFTQEEILLQIHRINPKANLGEVVFTPGLVCFYITVSVANPPTD